MRIALTVVAAVVALLAVFLYMAGIIGPERAAEIELDFAALSGDQTEEEVLARLEPARFTCGDEDLPAGERACFAGVSRIDGVPASYVALLFDGDRHLAAVNVILSPEGLEGMHERLARFHGQPTRTIDDDLEWVVWEMANGVVMIPAAVPDDTQPVVAWFRDPDLMERLLPH